MLTKLLERRVIKAHCYWPNEVNETEIFGDVSVTLISQNVDENLQIIVRQFKLTNGIQHRNLCHIHFLDWPDFGVPDSTASTLKTLEIMEKFRSLYKSEPTPTPSPTLLVPDSKRKRHRSHEDMLALSAEHSLDLENFTDVVKPQKQNATVLVHCSAGVGRSGTFIAIQAYIENLREGKPRTVKEIVSHLRKYRMCMVQTKDQYKFIYRVVEDYANSNKDFLNGAPPSLLWGRKSSLSETHDGIPVPIYS